MTEYNLPVPPQGWCPLNKAQRLFELVKQTHEQFGDGIISVECGVFGGQSLAPMAFAHKELNAGYAFGIDTWDNTAPLEGSNSPENAKWWRELDIESIYFSFIAFVMENKLSKYCRWLQARTDFASRVFDNDSITLLHQDSNHSKEVILRELELWIPKLKIGGYWVADDIDWVETQEAYAMLPTFGLKELENHTKWSIWQKVEDISTAENPSTEAPPIQAAWKQYLKLLYWRMAFVPSIVVLVVWFCCSQIGCVVVWFFTGKWYGQQIEVSYEILVKRIWKNVFPG